MNKKRNLRVGILGLTFTGANLGCQALSYSFLNILQKISEKNNWNIDLYIMDGVGIRYALTKKGYIKSILPNYECSNVKYHLVPLFYDWKQVIVERYIKKCDIVFDFTAGDSFTDIYGQTRFEQRTALKEKVIESGVPLVLGSQTIGPFSEENEKRVSAVISACKEVFVRDERSKEYVKKSVGRDAILTTDVAFTLPYNQPKSVKKNTIGINPSGLLWSGGYTQDNQFGLTVDYQYYLKKVIETLINEGKEVHLIPHVWTHLNSVDNDLIACEELKKEFPDVIIAPEFDTPMDAKSYIAQMEVFTGARMHATIAAYSSGTAVIPFSYSRKFEGLFESLEYHYTVCGYQDSTEEAIAKTLKGISERALMLNAIEHSKATISKKNYCLYSKVEELLKALNKGF